MEENKSNEEQKQKEKEIDENNEDKKNEDLEIKEDNNKEINNVNKEEIKDSKIEENNEEKKEEKEESQREENKQKDKEENIKEGENMEKNEQQESNNENNDIEEVTKDEEESTKKNEKEEESDKNTNENESSNTNDNSQLKVTMTIVENDDYTLIDKEKKKDNALSKDFIDDKNRCNTLTQKLVNKTKKNANMKLDEFFTKKRHYLIMTDGGKPVYSRYGDEVENNSIFATISAMITKFTIFNNTDDFKEEINIISNNKNKIVFMKKGQLIFIALSKKVDDSVSLLHSQLEYIYNQLMSILTVRFYEKLEDNPSKCLTAMGGTENLFEQIIHYSSNSFISLFNSYQIMNFVNFGENRDKINKILEEFKGNALYCILMTPYEIISFVHSNQIMVSSSDLVLVQNLIFCTEMLRTQESYVPICLPGISDQGFLQLYSHFSEENIGIIFVTENMDPMCFMEFQKKYKEIYSKIYKNYSENIIECMRKNNNIKGKYSLFKDKDQNKENNLSDETLVNKLLNKIKKHKGYQIDNEKISELKENINNDFSRVNTYNINNSNNNLTNIKSGSYIFENIIYGVVLNRKYNQYIMLNFGMDYRTYDKKEKKLIQKYVQLFDIYNNYKDKEKEKEEFYYIEKSDKYYNVIKVNEYFIIICSFNFFINIEDISKRIRDILKYLKKYENRYFIIYK